VKHCAIPGCHAPAYSRTYCAMHDQRLRRHGDATYERPYHTACTVPGCQRSTTGGRQLCGAHTARAYRLRKGGHL
jgi:hypothetical protein